MSQALPEAQNTLYLIDVSSFIFRAYFAIRPLTAPDKQNVNAVYGVAAMLARLAEEAHPDYLAVVYDSKEPSVRREIYAEYKANRPPAPDDLIPQFDRIEKLIEAMEMHSYRKSGIEADDLIATLTKRWCEMSKKHEVVIVSGDKDLMQLVDDRVKIWDTMKNVVYGPREVEEKFGVRPDQIRDYLALVGDSSDNIPGVPSIGPKSAVDLLKAHQTLDQILVAAKTGKISGKKGETIAANEKDAILSAQLATVREDIECKVVEDDFKYHFHVTENCAAMLRSLGFNSLLARWTAENKTHDAPPAHTDEDAPPAEQPAKNPSGAEFKSILTMAQLEGLLSQIEKKGSFGFDIETTSLNPREAELVGIAICVSDKESFYIPLAHRADPNVQQLSKNVVIEKLKPYLENPKFGKIGQNLKYDWSVLMEMGLKPEGIESDTMVAAYVLSPEGRHGLDTLSQLYMNYTVTTFEEVCGKGKTQISFDQVPIEAATKYSAEDAWCAYKLWEIFKPKLKSEKLVEIFEKVDLPLVPVLARMESQGVCIDVDYLHSLSVEFDAELKTIEAKIQAFAPKGPINLNSTKQLAQLLFEDLKLPTQSKTKTGYSTDASVLAALADLHEVPKLLLEYREISKLKGTYVDPLPAMRDAKTGKIHAGFHQAVAATGRLSSSDPNLQNIPIRTDRGMRIRRAFIPSPGNVLVSADYSQIELRLLAHMSGDPELVRSFKSNEDVHRRTASEIFGVKPEAVDDRQRGIAKAINFGLMYGKSAFGLAQELGIPRREAADIIQKYFERYHRVKQFLDGQIVFAKEKGYVSTLLGRKRPLPDINAKNPALRANSERMAMNSPIQGTAADLMKLAMIEIDRELIARKMKSKLIIQVHDEVLLDCPAGEVEQAKALITEVMEGALKLDVPLIVNSSVGKNWMEL